MKDTILKIEKSKDGEDRESLTIQINEEICFIPTNIITDFIESNSRNVMVKIPN